MRPNILPALVGSSLLAALSLVLSPAANAQSGCSNAGAAGQWGYTYSGTLFTPSGAIPVASVGTFVQDQAGHIVGRQTRSVAGASGEENVRGNIKVQSDCTASAVIRVYQGGKYLRTGYLNAVYVNGMKDARWIFESLVLPGHATLPVTITLDMNRV